MKLNTHLMRFLLLSFMASLSLTTLASTLVRAQPDWSWSDGAEIQPAQPVASFPYDTCATYYQPVTLEGQATSVNGCMSEGGRLRMVSYYAGRSGYAIGFPTDQRLYSLKGACDSYDTCTYIPSRDMLVTRQFVASSSARSLVVYKNVSQKLTRQFDLASSTYYYLLDTSAAEYVYRDPLGFTPSVTTVGVSGNGKYVAVELRGSGIAILDTDTMVMKQIASITPPFGYGRDPSPQLAVSNDGKAIFMVGSNAGLTLLNNTPTCGIIQEVSGGLLRPTVRPSCDQTPVPESLVIDNFYSATKPRFDATSGQLFFYAQNYFGTARYVGVRAHGYTPPSIDYLALGDSFSSGEGEQDDGRYLEGTNSPFAKCHTSDRSYPFLVGRTMGMTPQNVKSVACSGARIHDILGIDQDYWGQGNRLELEFGHDQSIKSTSQAYALEHFRPGEVVQSSFVSKYQPSRLSVGVGGNDVGFFDKLKACMMPDTCEWALDDKAKMQTAQEIEAIQGKLVGLYAQLRSESPQSRIYAIGYPQIIDTEGSCDLVTGAMFNREEKVFIREGVTYLNQVIAGAALQAGIAYIDVQDSLKGHELCGVIDQQAMNSLRGGDDVAPISLVPDLVVIGDESFHPTPFAHSLIAEAVSRQIQALDYQVCSTGLGCSSGPVSLRPSPYWGTAVPDRRALSSQIVVDDTVKAAEITVRMPAHSFEPGSSLEIEMHSSPVALGTYLADSEGGLEMRMTVPDSVTPGYHTVHIYGKSFSGEPMDFYQVIAYRLNKFQQPAVALNDTGVQQPAVTAVSSSTVDGEKEQAAVTTARSDLVYSSDRRGDVLAAEDSSLSEPKAPQPTATKMYPRSTVIVGIVVAAVLLAGATYLLVRRR